MRGGTGAAVRDVRAVFSPGAPPTSNGKWEAAGTVLVIAGVLSVMFAGPPISTIGSLAFVVGLVVFVIGRFN